MDARSSNWPRSIEEFHFGLKFCPGYINSHSFQLLNAFRYFVDFFLRFFLFFIRPSFSNDSSSIPWVTSQLWVSSDFSSCNLLSRCFFFLILLPSSSLPQNRSQFFSLFASCLAMRLPWLDLSAVQINQNHRRLSLSTWLQRQPLLWYYPGVCPKISSILLSFELVTHLTQSLALPDTWPSVITECSPNCHELSQSFRWILWRFATTLCGNSPVLNKFNCSLSVCWKNPKSFFIRDTHIKSWLMMATFMMRAGAKIAV